MSQPELLIPIFGIVWPFAALIVFLYLHYSTKNKISMALIESGRDASILQRPNRRYRTLKMGVVCIMAGLGLFVGNLLEKMGMNEEAAYFSAILIFIGVGLVGFYAFVSREQKKKGHHEEERAEEWV